MEQLVLDIASKKDATLIKELLKHFKGVEVNQFPTELSSAEMGERIEAGLKEAADGKVKPWKEVKSKLMKRIKTKSR